MLATTSTGAGYLSLLENVSGDPVRAFIPTRLGKRVTVVWLIHAFGSSHDAILGGYSGHAQAAVDAGFIAICPNLGGSLWSSPKAQTLLKVTYTALVAQLAERGVTIAHNIMVGTSHGGCLATYATAKGLIPNIRGLYLVNGVYDAYSAKGSYGSGMRTHYLLSGGTYATNPANLPASAFKVPVKIVYDETDPTVNAGDNGKKLAARLTAAGKPAEIRVHNSEHSTPPGTPKDIVARVKAWTA